MKGEQVPHLNRHKPLIIQQRPPERIVFNTVWIKRRGSGRSHTGAGMMKSAVRRCPPSPSQAPWAPLCPWGWQRVQPPHRGLESRLPQPQGGPAPTRMTRTNNAASRAAPSWPLTTQGPSQD